MSGFALIGLVIVVGLVVCAAVELWEGRRCAWCERRLSKGEPGQVCLECLADEEARMKQLRREAR